MSSIEDALDRPEFDSVDLDIGVDEAHRAVEAAVKGLADADGSDGRKYRTQDGRLVAILQDRPSDSGKRSATLAYRTAPASEPATRKAGKVRDAVRDHVVDT